MYYLLRSEKATRTRFGSVSNISYILFEVDRHFGDHISTICHYHLDMSDIIEINPKDFIGKKNIYIPAIFGVKEGLYKIKEDPCRKQKYYLEMVNDMADFSLPFVELEKIGTPEERKEVASTTQAKNSGLNYFWPVKVVGSLLNWAVAAPIKQTVKPATKVAQFAIFYGILAATAYFGYKFYNESDIWEKIPKISIQWSEDKN